REERDRPRNDKPKTRPQKIRWGLNHQLTRIGQGMMKGTLDADEQARVNESHKEFQEMYDEAMKDKKMTKAEFKALQEFRKDASLEIFSLKHNQIDMLARADRLQKRIAQGVELKFLTPGEAAAL